MSIRCLYEDEENQSFYDKKPISEDGMPRIIMLEYYPFGSNRKLEELIDSFDSHTVIDLSCQKLTDCDMAIIIKNAIIEKQCKNLNLWGNQFTYKSMLLLANVLNGNTNIKELDLSYNRLSDKGVKIISEVLSLNNCVIKYLDLSSNEITDEGAKYIGDMLTRNQILVGLTLNKNEITDDGLRLLGRSLANGNKKLRYLELESNPLITRESVIDVIDILKNNTTLYELYVKDCTIVEKDFDELTEMAFTTGFDVICTQ